MNAPVGSVFTIKEFFAGGVCGVSRDSGFRRLNRLLPPCRARLPVFLVAALLLLPLPADVGQSDPADPQNALLLVSSVTDRMLNALAGEEHAARDRTRRVEALVETHVLPHVDFERMSRLVLGKQWRSATAIQRKRFVEEFRRFLIRFYTAAFAEYTKGDRILPDMVRFAPLRERAASNRITVQSHLRQPQSGQLIAVNYQLCWARGQWKVYDVNIDGVSMVITYRNSFAAEIRKLGLDGLIKQLADKNRELAHR